jgi:hypothetical protein|tara:strand:- start:251 stop:517 length:267 start_codon:yes stop_codon:yes gene_type:complete
MTIKTKIRVDNNLIADAELQKLIDDNCKLLTSKQFAKVLQLKSDAALRKQRSKNRSLFPYARLGRRIVYPLDRVVQTIQNNVVESQLR